MKRNIILAAVMSLFVFVAAASAQKATNFGGTWTLDVSKSKLGERNSIESQTMTVTQTATDIKIETATKRMAPAGTPGAGQGGGGGRMGGGGMGGDVPKTYTFGKETKVDQTMGQMTVPVTMKATWDGAKLNLSSAATMIMPDGTDRSSSSKETWDLGADGKTLTVTVDRTTPRGTDSTTKVFTKN